MAYGAMIVVHMKCSLVRFIWQFDYMDGRSYQRQRPRIIVV